MRPLHATVFATFALAACGTDDPKPPAADTKLRLEMTTTIDPLSEVEKCKFVPIPDTWITHDTIEFSGGSHHVLVYQTKYTTIPTMKDNGTPVDTSGVFDCSDGATNGWSITKLIGGSQNRTGEAVLSFPEGIGVHIGGVAMINVHYINSTEAPIATEVKIAFDTMPADQITQEGC